MLIKLSWAQFRKRVCLLYDVLSDVNAQVALRNVAFVTVLVAKFFAEFVEVFHVGY